MSSSPTDSAAPAAPPAVADLRTGTLSDVTMPQMGVSVVEGTVVAWRVEVGDRIAAESTICEISTDKIDTEVPAPVGGVVTEILVEVESTVEIGTVLARIASDGDAVGGADSAASQAAAGAPAAPESVTGPPTAGEAVAGAPAVAAGVVAPAVAAGVEAPAVAAGVVAPPSRQPPAGRRYSPVVSRIAAEHGIDLAKVSGTGREGRVRKQDVLALVAGNGDAGASGTRASAPGADMLPEPPLHIESPYRPDPTDAVPGSDAGELSRMRRQIGEHMKRSLDTAAHCTTWIEVDMGRVEVARARLGVTALAFVARATIESLREHPALNAWLEGSRYQRVSEVNLGIAVSLGEDGLIVPVIQRAHELSVEGLAARIKDVARRARTRQLTTDDVRDGTFTITNPGQYGSIMATPIINQPQVAILDLEAVVKRPVVVTDVDGNDSIAIRPMTILGLSWDHRALDGALSAQFLASVKRGLEHGTRIDL